jgi:hypothetical protein
MATMNSLLISPSRDQAQVSICVKLCGSILIESSYNECPVFIEIEAEDWDSVKKFIDSELKKLNENG